MKIVWVVLSSVEAREIGLRVYGIWRHFAIIIDGGLCATSTGAIAIAGAKRGDRDALVATTAIAAATAAAGTGTGAATEAIHNVGCGLARD